MIDSSGFRPNIGIILANDQGNVLWAKRIGQNAWQFPQGGICESENPEEALYRELYEEIGLRAHQVSVIACTRGWLRYRLPKALIRGYEKPICVGQKQKWFLLKFNADDTVINLRTSPSPEFDQWRWVSYWYPIGRVVGFKRDVYRRAMKELAVRAQQLRINGPSP